MRYSNTSTRARNTPLSLIERLRTSDQTDDWNALVEIYRGLIETWLVRAGVGPNDVDDVLQESLLALLRGIKSFRHNGNPGAFRCWLRRLVMNRAVTHFRGLRRRNGKLEHRVPESLQMIEGRMQDDDWEEEHDRHVLNQLLRLAQGDFSWTTWRAFCLQVFDNSSPATVSRELGISPNAAMIAKSRVLKRLRGMAKGMIE